MLKTARKFKQVNHKATEGIWRIGMTDEDFRKLACSFDLPYAVYHKELLLFARAVLQAATRATPSADALKIVTSHLVAAVSLLERSNKKAAPSNTMFDIMLNDYKNAIEVGRKAIAASAPKGDGND